MGEFGLQVEIDPIGLDLFGLGLHSGDFDVGRIGINSGQCPIPVFDFDDFECVFAITTAQVQYIDAFFYAGLIKYGMRMTVLQMKKS